MASGSVQYLVRLHLLCINYIYVKIMMIGLIMAAYYADRRGKRSNHNLNIAYRPHSMALITLGLLNRHRFNVIYLTTPSV